MTSRALISNSQFIEQMYLSVCTDKSARIMKMEPFHLISTIPGGPFCFAVVSQNRTFAVVDSDTAPFLSNFVLIYHLSNGSFMKSIEFNSKVLNLHANETHIFVSLSNSIQILESETLITTGAIERKSSTGVCSVSDKIIAYTNDDEPGKVIIASIPGFSVDKRLQCHKERVCCISVSPNSQYITTASEKGTLVRVHSLADTKFLSEFRRGYRGAEVISVETNNGITSCCTNSTLHIFPARASHITVPLRRRPITVSILDDMVYLVTDDGILSIYKVDRLTNEAKVQIQHKLHSLSVIDQTEHMKRHTSL